MALHVTIIIWQIYMIIMVELNAEQKIQKQNNNKRAKSNQPSNNKKTGQRLTGFLVWVLPDTPILYF